MKYVMICRGLVAGIALIAGMDGSARADETAVSFDDSLINVGTGGSNVYGWQFSTVSDIEVSSLGLYDYYHGDGLVAQHPVGIWDVSDPSQLLLSAVIPAGSSASMANDFRYVQVNPVMLPAGHDYVVAALYNQDDPGVGELNAPSWLLTVGPGLQFGGYRFGQLPTTSFIFPQFYIAGQEEMFGPNFTYSVVPEPSTWSLFALGMTVLIIQKTRRRADCSKGF